MGGASRRGGSDTSDEKRQDSYSKQFRKQYTVNKKTGKPKKRNIISRILINSPTGTAIGDFADNHNYKRRLKFAEKNNLNLVSKSKEYLMSPAARTELDKFGYADTLKDKSGINDKTRDRDSANQNRSELKIGKPDQPDEGEVTTTLPFEPSYGDEENLTAEEIALKNKRKGRKRTVLTSVTGDTSKATLGKRTLLGG